MNTDCLNLESGNTGTRLDVFLISCFPDCEVSICESLNSALFVVISVSSKLLKLAAAGFQQCEETIRAAHVTRADHHEIRFAAAKIAVDF